MLLGPFASFDIREGRPANSNLGGARFAKVDEAVKIETLCGLRSGMMDNSGGDVECGSSVLVNSEAVGVPSAVDAVTPYLSDHCSPTNGHSAQDSRAASTMMSTMSLPTRRTTHILRPSCRDSGMPICRPSSLSWASYPSPAEKRRGDDRQLSYHSDYESY